MFTPLAPWLDPGERTPLVAAMYHYGLLKCSNARDLPLKMGSTTDIYINLRDARNNPDAIQFIAEKFSHPLRRLRPDRFIEVPDAVSCFAGPLSIETRIPVITIRESPKAGRVAKATSIGSAPYGATCAMIDDVITDGGSKEGPFFEAKKLGLKSPWLIVLVDRQQGWQQKFAELGIDMQVWAGMTLHDVRRILIRDLGIMERCAASVEANNPIIVALDGMSRDATLGLADRLRPTGSILKVNDVLFDDGIAHLLPDLSVYGRVMADLKSHDIPNTVANICKRLRACPPWATTVQASGAGEMVKAAVDALEGTPTKVLAVTVLTSIDKATCDEVYHRRPLTQVKVLAKLAADAGAHGFVCSPEEASVLRQLYPNLEIVTPGVRSDQMPKDDQARVATPKGAIDSGATKIVMGRQLTNAIDPVAEVLRVRRDELKLAA